MSFSKVAAVGLALISAVSGFNAGLPGFALRPSAHSGLTSLSMSGIGNTKSIKPDDSRRGGKTKKISKSQWIHLILADYAKALCDC